MPIAIGIDFEDIAQIPAYRSLSRKPVLNVDLKRVTGELITILDNHDVRATFFVVGELAREYPNIIHRIADAGHEIASHSQTHQSLTELEDEELSRELVESKDSIASITGYPPKGFRAPTCRIESRTYDELAAAGYRYSSSVLPTWPFPGFYSQEFRFSCPVEMLSSHGSIIELPISVEPTLRFPLAGAWIRLFGRRYITRGLARAVAADRPVLTYSHPWEFVRIDSRDLPFRTRIRTGEWMTETFRRMLDLDVEYCTAGELHENIPVTRSYQIS